MKNPSLANDRQLMANLTDLLYQLLGIAPNDQPPDHYRLLGLARLELNTDVIDHAAERQLDHLQRYMTGLQRAEVAAICDQIEQARRCLLSHASHLRYAGQLQGYQSDAADLDLQAAWRTFAEEFDEAWRTAQSSDPDAQHLWLGIPRHQRPASNDRLLGLTEGERNAQVIRSAAERQIGFVRKFASGENSEQANLLLGQLSRARSTLLRATDSATAHGVAQSNPAETEQVSPEVVVDFEDLDLSDANLLHEPPPPAVAHPAPVPSAVTLNSSTDHRKNKHAASIVAIASGVLAVLILAGWLVSSLLRDEDNAVSQRPSNPFVPAGPNPRGPNQRVPNQRTTGPVNPSNSQPTDLEIARFIARARTMPPSELDVDEIERHAAMARTDYQRSGIDYLRVRHANWQNHLQRIDDARMIGDLIGMENALSRIERRLAQKSLEDDDSQTVFDTIERVGKLPGTFPHHTQASRVRHSALKERADRLLEQINSYAATQPATTNENPFVVVEQPNSTTPPTDVTTPVDSSPPATEISAVPAIARQRKWTTSNGLSFDALVEDVDAERVMFRRSSDDRKASMAIDQLIESDQSILRAIFYDQVDAQQYQSAVTLVAAIEADPEAVIDQLKDRHLEFPESPYAGLWSAVSLSEGRNRFEEAARLLLQVIRRIDDQRDADEQRHAMTLAAACNNLAVCKIKDSELDAAAIQLAKALEVAPVPLPAAVHNARQLLALTGPRAIKSSSKSKLERVLPGVAEFRVTLQPGWFYSLDANVPPSTDHGNSGLRDVSQTVTEDPVVKNHWCLNCKGTGKTPCGYGNCVRGVVVVKQRVQVALNQVTGEAIYGDKNFKQTCPNCRGAGGFDCRECDEGKIR